MEAVQTYGRKVIIFKYFIEIITQNNNNNITIIRLNDYMNL